MPAPIRREPQAWAVALLHRYIRWSARRRFQAWHWAAEDEEAIRTPGPPILWLANHSAWWDGFLAFELAAALGQAPRVMMQADQLARYRFFARCGAFSLDRAHARQAYDDLRHAADLLRSGQGVWMFPQGRLASPYAQPLRLEGGAARLALWSAPVRIVPVAFRYVFLAEPRPQAFASCGRPIEILPGGARRGLEATIREALAGTVASLDARLKDEAYAGFGRLL